nr:MULTISPECIES: GIY-YIG nuclease family protein [unclassified Streptomyces]
MVGTHQARPVKIGVANDVEVRVRELQIGSPVPLYLIWKTRGGQALERDLHERFAPYRIHGEWFDFGDENPAALVATAAVLMGYVTHAERAHVEHDYVAPRIAYLTGKKSLINHLIDAANTTGRGNVTKQEVFAYMASVDLSYVRVEGESDRLYWSRVGRLLAATMVEQMLDVPVAQLTLIEGQPRVRGFRLNDLQEVLAELLERRPPRRARRRAVRATSIQRSRPA